MKKIVLILIILAITYSGIAQENVTTFGFMIKPIIPSNLFRAGDISISTDRNDLSIGMSQRMGYSFGMVIRHGINKNWTFETGLNYVQRRFTLDYGNSSTNFSESLTYGIVGYELPIMGLLNIKLGDQIFMNTAFGPVVDMFPSNVQGITKLEELGGEYVEFLALRTTWVQFSLNANLGWEYRTEKKGIFYIGGSYHRPFYPMYRTKIFYDGLNGDTHESYVNISGNYLTMDLRYFFHEDPEKRKSRQQRKKERAQKEKEKEIFYRPGIDGSK